jgi:hypothetical protein
LASVPPYPGGTSVRGCRSGAVGGQAELDAVIGWFTGYDLDRLDKLVDELAKGRPLAKVLRA